MISSSLHISAAATAAAIATFVLSHRDQYLEVRVVGCERDQVG